VRQSETRLARAAPTAMTRAREACAPQQADCRGGICPSVGRREQSHGTCHPALLRPATGILVCRSLQASGRQQGIQPLLKCSGGVHKGLPREVFQFHGSSSGRQPFALDVLWDRRCRSYSVTTYQ
jgi:hypothetical protein